MTNTKQEVIYEAAKETAKKIRAALKSQFPGVKFSVRSSVFAGGDSVDVSWTDGPMSNEVDAILDQFKSGHFNGMEDIYEYSAYSYEGKLYNGAKYVMGQRCLSDEYRQQIQSYLEENYSKDVHNDWYWFNQAEKEMLKGNQTEKVTEQVEEVSGPIQVVSDQDITVSMNINEDKNGIELSFTGIPSKATRELIKENGYKWSAFKKVWYCKKSDSALLFAEAFISAYNDVTEHIEKVSEQIEVVEIATNETIPEVESDPYNNEVIETPSGYYCHFKSWHFESNDIAMLLNKHNIPFEEAGEKFLFSGLDVHQLNMIKLINKENGSILFDDSYKHDEIQSEAMQIINNIPNVTESHISNKQPAKVLDFTSRFKQRQETKEAEQMKDKFINEILPNMDQSDKDRLFESSKDETKFAEVLQDILIKVSFKQAVTEFNKG